MNGNYAITRSQPWRVLLVITLLAIPLLLGATAVLADGAEANETDCCELVTIRARKYDDLNMNGERNDGEPYLEGWTMNVYDIQGALVGSKVTDVDGWAVWNDVPAGEYTVCEELQNNWVNTQAGALTPGTAVNGEVCSQLQPLEPEADWTFLFGNYELPRLRVVKYNDLNMDGKRQNFGDYPEVGLGGWTMNVYDGNGNPVDSKMTGPNGYYTWRVPPGAYTVCEELQQHWVNTQAGELLPGIAQNGEVCSHEQTLMPGELYEFPFGNYELAHLRVLKYNDLNQDGERLNFGPEKEPGLEGWDFVVYDANDTFVDTQDTGPNGYYTWHVPPGEYTVCEVLQDGWVNTEADGAPGTTPGFANPDEVCAARRALATGELYQFDFGNYFEEPPPGFCPSDELVYEVTDLLGVGQGSPKKAYRSRTLNIPNYEDVAWLYGQLAAVDVGQMKYVRFRYPDKSYVQIKNPTSPAYHTYMINWWGDYLEPAKFIKGQFFWKKSARLAPRAFVLWPTYMTDEPYANTFRTFNVSKENHVFWKTTDAAYEWFPEQTQKLTLPPTQAQGADIVVKVALVDVDMDQRPVILTVSAGGVSESRVIFVSNKRELLNLETFVLKGVDEGTSEVVIHLLSPAPSAEYPDGGDSVAMIGAAAHYACETNGIGTPDPD